MTEENTQFAEDRIDHLEQLEEQDINPYPTDTSTPTQVNVFCNNYENVENIEDENTWTLAGRVTRKNTFGDFSFFDIDDRTNSVQVLCRRADIDEYDVLEDHINLGDQIVFTGYAGRSNTGELTLFAEEYKISSKSLTEYSTEWNSLGEQQQIEQRTSALVTNDNLFNSVRTRFEIQQFTREYLTGDNFLEVETPTIDTYSGGNNSTDFDTYCESINQEMSLRVAPEMYLKRLITAGYSQIYEIARCYRNESIDTTHNPEFTMLELYQSYADYEDMMNLTEHLIEYVTRNIHNTTTINFDEEEIDMSAPWERRSFDSLVNEYISEVIGSEEPQDICSHIERQFDVNVSEELTYDEILLELFEEAIEPELVGPIFVTDYPTVSTPLCRTHDDDSSRVQRFEAFVCGMEIANAYTELTNPVEQQERFMNNSDDDSINSEFIEAIANGMPPTGGLGIGMDRIAMILTDSQSIKNVLPYPLTSNRV